MEMFPLIFICAIFVTIIIQILLVNGLSVLLILPPNIGDGLPDNEESDGVISGVNED